jgi:hypothetical protein
MVIHQPDQAEYRSVLPEEMASEASSMKSGCGPIRREPSLCFPVVRRISAGRNLQPTSPKYRPSDRSVSNTSIRSTIPATSEQGLVFRLPPRLGLAHKRDTSSATISAAGRGWVASATLCPAHMESASMSPVVLTMGGAGS